MAAEKVRQSQRALREKAEEWRRELDRYHNSPICDGWDGDGRCSAQGAIQRQDRAAVREAMLGLARVSRDLAGLSAGLVDEHALLKLARSLIDAPCTSETQYWECHFCTVDAETIVEQIELRSGRPVDTPHLGTGGPGRTFDAVCRAILSAKTGKCPSLVAGDETTHAAAKEKARDEVDPKKAADHMAPRGRLCMGGWIQRAPDRVILTEQGASEGMKRLQSRRQPARNLRP